MNKEIIDIEKLVRWALVDQRAADAMKALEAIDKIGMASCVGRLEEVAELGTTVQQGYADKLLVRETADDAFEVYSAVNQLPERARNLVIAHAMHDTRPDWFPEGAGKRVPRIGAGRGGKAQAKIKMSDGTTMPIFDWDGPSPTLVNQARAEYLVWWEGLAALVVQLQKNLSRYIAQPPRAARTPWDWSEKKVG